MNTIPTVIRIITNKKIWLNKSHRFKLYKRQFIKMYNKNLQKS
jgi:hypothetical protein